MTSCHVLVLVSFILYTEVHCSICVFHSFNDKYFTDLNYMIQEFDNSIWYVVAFERPNVPYATPYHLPQDIVTKRNCYSYKLSTRFGVIRMQLECRGAQAVFHSFDIFTRPNGLYVIGTKGQQEVRDFRVVNVLQLTETMVLLLSCSKTFNTYGVLVLNRGTATLMHEEQFHKIIATKLPYPLHPWMNYTMTLASKDKEQCNCGVYDVRARETDFDKRKGFVLITIIAAVALMGIVKVLKPFLSL